jgi:hypothetical protein
MIHKIKISLLSLSSLFFLAIPLLVGGTVNAAITQTGINQGVCSGGNGDISGNTPDCSKTGNTSINNLISDILNVLSAVVGIIAVIMIIVAGITYVSSGGSPDKVKSAKNMILYAIIGLVIVALAQIIVHFVLNKVTTATASGS